MGRPGQLLSQKAQAMKLRAIEALRIVAGTEHEDDEQTAHDRRRYGTRKGNGDFA